MAAEDRLIPEVPEPEGRRRLILLLFVGWLIAVSVGIYAVWRYSSQPGEASRSLTHWPVESKLALSKEKLTLLMFLHPKCPCSRTSVNELAILLGRRRSDFETTVVFIHPSGVPDEWSKTGLRDKVAALPGVQIFEDREGREGKRFQAATSGETFLFNPAGELLFHGGITLARGHAGNNEGRRFLTACKEASPEGAPRHTSVFGCPLEGLCSEIPSAP